MITIEEITFNINNNLFVFELFDKIIHDFYIKVNNSLNIKDIIMIKEMSYIKNLLI